MSDAVTDALAKGTGTAAGKGKGKGAAAAGPKDMTKAETKGVLDQVIGRYERTKAQISNVREHAEETGESVLSVVETQGTLFLASMGEGYFGKEKLQVGGIDGRGVVGALSITWGLVDTLRGKKGSSHKIAIGQGLLGATLASVGIQCGRDLAEKKDKAADKTVAPTPPAATADTVPPPAPAEAPKTAGPLKQMDLSNDDFGGRRDNSMMPLFFDDSNSRARRR